MLELSGIGLIAAFAAGAVSFVSPCVLPLVPGYVSYVAGHTLVASDVDPVARRRQAIGMSLYFVLGFSTVFMVLGASATALGQMLLSYRYELNFVGGGVVILFGLFMIGMARISVMQREVRFHLSTTGGQPLSAYVLGLAFGFGWTPCIGPILGAILTASAAIATVGEGIALLAIYSAGLGVPFLLAAAFTDHLTRSPASDRAHRTSAASDRRAAHGGNGHRHDHRAAFGAVLLAAGCLSDTGDGRVTRRACAGTHNRSRSRS